MPEFFGVYFWHKTNPAPYFFAMKKLVYTKFLGAVIFGYSLTNDLGLPSGKSEPQYSYRVYSYKKIVYV